MTRLRSRWLLWRLYRARRAVRRTLHAIDRHVERTEHAHT